ATIAVTVAIPSQTSTCRGFAPRAMATMPMSDTPADPLREGKVCSGTIWTGGENCGWAAVMISLPTVLPIPTMPTVAVTTIPVQIDRRTTALISAAVRAAGTMKIGDPI